MMVGALAALPAMFHKEWLSLPFAMLCGAAGGLLREVTEHKERVWSFGPFALLNVPRWVAGLVSRGELAWQVWPLLLCIGLEMLRIFLGSTFPRTLYYVRTEPGWPVVLPVLATLIGTALTLMIWNNNRIQLKLKEQEASLLSARMEALTSQINPHFLFNTLNTIGSLTRVEPEAARTLLVKLSNILRRLLRKHENFVPLRDEVKFIDDYLDIEMSRFGPEKLRFEKEIDDSTLDAMVPSMLLQPMVENSIRHGLAPRLEGGEIRLRTARENGRVVIDLEDNGIGIPADRIPEIYSSGIGISNVNERLKVLYGQEYTLKIDSEPGRGTSIRIELPEVFGA
jgi:two-component system LytT family sensor kinase